MIKKHANNEDSPTVSTSTPNKRQKLSYPSSPPSKDEVELESGSESGSGPCQLNLASTPISTSSKSSPLPEGRPPCQYGVKCYRRNAQHLMEFCHPLLDKIYEAMLTSGDFTKLPPQFDGPGTERIERRTLLEQLTILIDANKTQDTPPSSAPRSTSTSLADLREEQRKKFLQSKNMVSTPLPSNPQSCSNSTPTSRTLPKTKSMLDKWEASRPYNYFLTKIAAMSEERDGFYSASFTDLFDPSLGEIKALIHFNYMVDPDWFMVQTISAGLQDKPTRVVLDGGPKELTGHAEGYPSIKLFGVKSPFPYGHHHTKMSIAQYTDLSMRFFIYTANLIESDWANRTQGIWISPRCPKIDSTVSGSSVNGGDSCTKFRADMIQYLATYPIQVSRAWIDIIRTVDCSEIKVYLVASAPVTSQSSSSGLQWGTCKVEKVLKSLDSAETDPSWPLVIQCSSIGTLGSGIGDWVQSELASAFAGKDRIQQGPIHVVYPSHSNVRSSYEGLAGGGCLPYSGSTHKKQPWLEKYFRQWKAEISGRSQAVPHVKSYFRFCPNDPTKLAWFLLTSANLSKAAWGKLTSRRDRLTVMSWEAGVLFIPQLLISQPHFQTVTKNYDRTASSPLFPLHIDLPVVKYEMNDKPWVFDTLQALMLRNPS